MDGTDLHEAVVNARRLEIVHGGFGAPGPRSRRVRVNVEKRDSLEALSTDDLGVVLAVALREVGRGLNCGEQTRAGEGRLA